MPVAPSAAMAAFVHDRLTNLLRAPDAWGPPQAVELQLLLLVEMWHVVNGASREHVDGVTERYDRFVGSALPGAPLPLALRLGLTTRANERFTEILGAFLRAERAAGREASRVPATARTLPTAEYVGEA